jgi:DNA-binding response OmpR family regulator
MVKPKVLVVDDSVTALHYLSGILEQLGYETLRAGDADQALAFLAEQEPDLVLSDLVMPGMDGLDLLEEMRSRGHAMPLLIITSHASLNTAVQAVRKGADDYIVRPVDPELLAHRILAVRERHQMRLEHAQRMALEAALATAGAAAHELNQPLMAMAAVAELMGTTKQPERMKELAKLIADQAERAGKITHRLVNLVRFETKTYVGEVKILDLQASSKEPGEA